MKKFKQITLFFSTFITFLVLSEIFIQTAHLSEMSFSEFYNDIGRGRRKNLNYLIFNEGFGIGRFNEHRYIGKVAVVDKNSVRIALLGDSFIESFQIFERDYFGVLAKKNLEKKFPGKKFEFLNFGRSGFDIANIYTYQKIFVDKFDVDFIFYMLSKEDLNPKYLDPLNPKTILKKNQLIISLDFDTQQLRQFQFVKFLIQHSAFFQMLNKGRKKAKKVPLLSIFFGKIYAYFAKEKEAKEKEAKTLLSEHDTDYQINPVTTKIIESLDSSKVIIINRDSQKLPLKFRKICLKNGLRYFDLSQSLNMMKKSGNDPYEWNVTRKTGHWNRKAHKMIAKEIALLVGHLLHSRNAEDKSTTF